ncbi:MAG TPA: ROK family protein [Herpetosiphonaceae bacterium]
MTDDMLVLGLDIDEHEVQVGLGTRDGPHVHRTVAWPDRREPLGEMRFVVDLAREFARKHVPGRRIYAAGIALDVVVNYSDRIVSCPSRPRWRGLPLQAYMRKMGLPIVIESHVNAAVMAEYMLGAARGHENALVVLAGTDISAGLILDGRLFRGDHRRAGEFGHIVVQADGPPCSCGMRGCLQVLASGRALERSASALGLADLPALVAAATNGNQQAQEAIVASGRYMGLAIASVVNLLDLRHQVIGGSLLKLGQPWWSAMSETVQANRLHRDDCSAIMPIEAIVPQRPSLFGVQALAVQLADSISSAGVIYD